MRVLPPLLAGLVGLALGATAGQSQDRSAGLIDLLSRVPADLLAGLDGPDVSFADFAAAAEVMAPDGGDTAALARLGPLARATLPMAPAALSGAVDGLWPDLVGFGLTDVQTILTLNAPPASGMILRLSNGAISLVEPALARNGYVATAVHDMPALERNAEDFGISLIDRQAADPFGNGMGQSSRVTMAEDYLYQSNNWPMLAALAGTAPAMSGELEALAAAIDDPAYGDAVLLQAIALPPQGRLGSKGSGGLPAWSQGWLVDLGAGQDTVALAIFLYDDQPTATRAADLALAGWSALPTPQSGRTFAELIGAEATTSVAGEGPFAAVLALRQPAAYRRGIIENIGYTTLLRAAAMRDLDLFGPE